MEKFFYEGKEYKIFPDLIVHHRGDNSRNVIAIELKKKSNSSKAGKENDYRKLRALTSLDYIYKYELGLAIVLANSRKNVEIKYFINDREINIKLSDKKKNTAKKFEISCEERFKKTIELLFKDLMYAKEQFYIFKDICMNSYYQKYDMYYTCIFDAIYNSILVKLAKIYDEDASGQSITIYKILNSVNSQKAYNKNDVAIIKYIDGRLKILNSDRYKSARENLKYMRDKSLAHYDKKYVCGLKSMKSEDKIKYNETADLIDFSYETIKEIYRLCFNEDITERDISILKKQNETLKERIQ